MKNKKEKDEMWTLIIEEDDTITGDIEAIRKIYHKQEELGLSFDMAPYCG